MGPDIENLMQLQVADREIRRLQEEIAALPKRVAVIEEKLASHKAALDTAKTAVKADEADRKKFETAIQDLRLKISKYRDQSLEVKTNDHYKALMHEIQFAEQDIQTNEDKILELMVNVEAREQKVKAAEAELKAESAVVEKEKKEARELAAIDQNLLAEWTAKREATRVGVNPDLIRHYKRVMKFRGSGIAEVRDQKCPGCQTMLRPQTYNEVRSGQTIVCESCQRILYFDPKREDAATKPVPVAKKKARAKVVGGRVWFYRPHYDQIGEAFIALANGEMRASCRVYDAHSGRKIGPTRNREGSFVTAFEHEISGGHQLRTAPEEKQLDSWGDELPSVILDELHADVKALNLIAPEAQSAVS